MFSVGDCPFPKTTIKKQLGGFTTEAEHGTYAVMVADPRRMHRTRDGAHQPGHAALTSTPGPLRLLSRRLANMCAARCKDDSMMWHARQK